MSNDTPTETTEPTQNQPDVDAVDPLADDFEIGDPVVDLANGRNMVIVDRAADRADDWTEANGYDLLGNTGNDRLRARAADPVFTCVYVVSVGSEPSKTYDFPSSRLGRAQYENAGESVHRVYELVARDILDQMFEAAFATDGDKEWGGIPPVEVLESLARFTDLDDDVVDEAFELGKAAAQFDDDDAGEESNAHASRVAEQLAMADDQNDV